VDRCKWFNDHILADFRLRMNVGKSFGCDSGVEFIAKIVCFESKYCQSFRRNGRQNVLRII
jgi:hypothetical protein